jgi:hypothetical protein
MPAALTPSSVCALAVYCSVVSRRSWYDVVGLKLGHPSFAGELVAPPAPVAAVAPLAPVVEPLAPAAPALAPAAPALGLGFSPAIRPVQALAQSTTSGAITMRSRSFASARLIARLRTRSILLPRIVERNPTLDENADASRAVAQRARCATQWLRGTPHPIGMPGK